MALYASKVIEIAKSQIGYKEVGNNHTKYSKELDAIKYYNTQKDPASADWCAIFTDWCIYQATGKDKAQALKANYEPTKDNCGASCYYQFVYYDSHNKFYKSPKAGDKVIFGTALKKGSITHIGIVIAVDGNKITTVEGNKSNSVKKCSYTLGSKGSKVLGFLRPAYDKEPAPEPTPTPEPPKPTPTPTPEPKGKVVKASHSADAFKSDLKGTYTVTTSLNMRDGAGTGYKILTVLAKGDKVKCYGFYSINNGLKWLYVTITKGNITYEGFCCSKYLKG